MDYEKKIREYMVSSKVDQLYKSMLINIFPELAESEGEKIRKALIKLVKKAGEGYENVIDGVSKENAISWLEKQGEQKPVEWSEEDKKHYNMCLQYFATIKEDSIFYEDYLWLKSLRPQKYE